MRKILFTLLSCLCLSASAQTIDWGPQGSSMKCDSIAKKILEAAQYEVTYAYTYVRDANNPKDTRSGMTLLQVGNRYNRFCDFYRHRFDSIDDDAARRKLSVVEVSNTMLSMLKQSRFTESIIIDKQKNKETIQRTAGLSTLYQYDEGCPQLKWEMLEGDTVIAGYHCSKARTSLFGRDYIAWYSPEVNMPYGPYKFNGLPGLVFRVVDTQGNFDFTLNGLQKAGGYKPIYMWGKKDIIKTDRKTVRKIYKNYCADPVGALTSDGSVQVPDDVKATVGAKPYNPIELE